MKQSIYSVNIFSFLTVLVAVMIGRTFMVPPLSGSIVWPAIGISFGLVLVYKEKVIFPLFLATFIGQLAMNAFINPTWLTLSIQPFILSLHTMLIIYIGAYFFKALNITPKLSTQNGFKAIAVFFIMALFQALLANIGLLLFSNLPLDLFLESVLIWGLGGFFGFIVFGVPTYFSLTYDETPITFKYSQERALFFIAYFLFTLFILNDYIPFINFSNFKYLYIAFYVFIAFRYSYRMFYTVAFFTLFMMVIFPPFRGDISNIAYLFDVNFFLGVNLLVVLILKNFLIDIKENEAFILSKSDRLEKLIEATQTLFTLGHELNTVSKNTIDDQVKKIFRTIFTLFEKADYGSIAIVDKRVRFLDAIGFDVKALNALNFNSSDWKFAVDEPFILKNAEDAYKKELKDNYEAYHKNAPEVKETLFISIRITKEVMCDLSFDIAKGSLKSFDDMDFMYFSSMQKLIGSFYDSQELAIEYDTIKDDIVLSLIKTIELFDPSTTQHSFDVANFATSIGKKLGLSQDELTDLYWAGILHDIGKVGLDNTILTAPKTLSISEYEHVKSHPILGYEILKQSKELFRISNAVKHHHEALDGSGYPDGLTRDLIPFISKILAVCEMVTTLARTQVYQPQASKQAIIDELSLMRGKLYDEAITDVSINLIIEGAIDDYYQ
ncbi:MAG: HD domain-containing phosphohydrolase, partial [Candidatus Izemoplasmataceae bacterium]